MTSALPAIAVAGAVVYAFMIVEARRAARNERLQRMRGGVEPRGDVYPVMQVAYPVGFLLMIVEGLWRGPAATWAVAVGVAVFTAGKALKWWAIVALGTAWTFRVVVVPGTPLVHTGPYRYLRHPNYAGVVGEFAGVALLTGALVAGPVVTAGFLLLMLRRVRIEREALDRSSL